MLIVLRESWIYLNDFVVSKTIRLRYANASFGFFSNEMMELSWFIYLIYNSLIKRFTYFLRTVYFMHSEHCVHSVQSSHSDWPYNHINQLKKSTQIEPISTHWISPAFLWIGHTSLNLIHSICCQQIRWK